MPQTYFLPPAYLKIFLTTLCLKNTLHTGGPLFATKILFPPLYDSKILFTPWYALNDKTLNVQNFNYDGAGPDAFFWVGVEGSPDNVKNESTTAILAHPFQGKHYEYRNQDAPILGAASNEAVTLILPEHLKVCALSSQIFIQGGS